MDNKSFFEQLEENIFIFLKELGKATGFIKFKNLLDNLTNKKGE